MKHCTALLASTGLATMVHASDAQTYSLSRSVTVDAPADEIWHVIGDFCDLDDWHPAFVACAPKAPEGGGVHRVLTMDGGGAFLEKLIAHEPGLSYTYSIVEGPLPLERYTGTLSIRQGDQVEITWSSRFSSADPEMEALVAGVYESGLAAIAAHFAE